MFLIKSLNIFRLNFYGKILLKVKLILKKIRYFFFFEKDEANNIKKFFEKFKDFDANLPLNPVTF